MHSVIAIKEVDTRNRFKVNSLPSSEPVNQLCHGVLPLTPDNQCPWDIRQHLLRDSSGSRPPQHNPSPAIGKKISSQAADRVIRKRVHGNTDQQQI